MCPRAQGAQESQEFSPWRYFGVHFFGIFQNTYSVDTASVVGYVYHLGITAFHSKLEKLLKGMFRQVFVAPGQQTEV